MVKKDNFFFIDSTNYSMANSRLYGYALCESNDDIDFLADEQLYSRTINGCFCAVQNLSEKLCISQDYYGCYGIFVFFEKDYFAISNSYLYLIENISCNYTLHLNEDFINHMLVTDNGAYAYVETAIDEIALLPRNVSILINKQTGLLSIYHKKRTDGTVLLESREALNIIDEWAYSWAQAIWNIFEEKKAFVQDLSGGMDSRLSLVLLLLANIDKSKVTIRALRDKLFTHAEDFEIAKSICEFFGISIDYVGINKNKKLSLKSVVDMSFYTKQCHSNIMHFKTEFSETPFFEITGFGGRLSEN